MSAPRKPRRPGVDWERVEVQYRAGVMSLREIAAAHNNEITESAIRKRANTNGWERDLEAKVRARTESLVRKEQVRTEVRTETASEKLQIEIDAQVRARVELTQRKDITAARELCQQLFAELHGQCDRPETLERLVELARESDAKMLEAIQRVVSFGGRVGSLKALSEALRNLVALERTAYRLDAPTDPGAGEGRQLTDLEIAAKMSYFLELGRRLKAQAEAAGA